MRRTRYIQHREQVISTLDQLKGVFEEKNNPATVSIDQVINAKASELQDMDEDWTNAP